MRISELQVNADDRDGSIGVEVLSGNGQIQLGFSIDNCVPLTGTISDIQSGGSNHNSPLQKGEMNSSMNPIQKEGI